MSSEDQRNGPAPADPTPRRVASSSKRTATAHRRAIIGSIAALVIAGVAVFVFTGGSDGPIGTIIPGGDETPETPEFAFELRRVAAETTTETKGRKLKREAEDVADQVKATLDELYVDGFVEPDTWGDWGEIEDLFDEVARGQAEADLDTLTLGASGSEAFTFLQPDRSTLAVDVLTDQSDRPVQALALVTFSGTADADDGSSTEIRSSGSFFLRHVDGKWKIYSYRVERADRKARGGADGGTPTATASSEAEG